MSMTKNALKMLEKTKEGEVRLITFIRKRIYTAHVTAFNNKKISTAIQPPDYFIKIIIFIW